MANLFVGDAQKPDDVANAIDAGIDLSLVNAEDALIAFLCVFDARQPGGGKRDILVFLARRVLTKSPIGIQCP